MASSNLGLKVLKTPYRRPQANSIRERAIWFTEAGLPGLHDSIERGASPKPDQGLEAVY
jgi:hypothetical protein